MNEFINGLRNIVEIYGYAYLLEANETIILTTLIFSVILGIVTSFFIAKEQREEKKISGIKLKFLFLFSSTMCSLIFCFLTFMFIYILLDISGVRNDYLAAQIRERIAFYQEINIVDKRKEENISSFSFGEIERAYVAQEDKIGNYLTDVFNKLASRYHLNQDEKDWIMAKLLKKERSGELEFNRLLSFVYYVKKYEALKAIDENQAKTKYIMNVDFEFLNRNEMLRLFIAWNNAYKEEKCLKKVGRKTC